MPYTDTHSAVPTGTVLTDVLDSGGDARRGRDSERLKAVVAGVAAGVLAYAVVAQGPWSEGRAAHLPPPAPVAHPVAVPRAPTPDEIGVTPAPAPEPRCRVSVHSRATGARLCFGTADAAARWLAVEREPSRAATAGGRS